MRQTWHVVNEINFVNVQHGSKNVASVTCNLPHDENISCIATVQSNSPAVQGATAAGLALLRFPTLLCSAGCRNELMNQCNVD